VSVVECSISPRVAFAMRMLFALFMRKNESAAAIKRQTKVAIPNRAKTIFCKMVPAEGFEKAP
jgi:hypothetical protein